MCRLHNLKPRYRYYADPQQRAGAGAVSNNRVIMCKYCRENGFPNEAITFTRHIGKWQPINYFDGTPQHHVHRQEVYEGN